MTATKVGDSGSENNSDDDGGNGDNGIKMEMTMAARRLQ